jgi:hypothetical protein
VIFVVFCNCFHLIYKKEVKIVGNNSLFVCLFVWAGVGAGAARTCVLDFLYVCLLLFFDSQDWEYVLSYNKYIKSIMVRALIVLGFLLICSSFNYVHDLQANLETILS